MPVHQLLGMPTVERCMRAYQPLHFPSQHLPVDPVGVTEANVSVMLKIIVVKPIVRLPDVTVGHSPLTTTKAP
jgi:hypothetical protein